MSTIKTFGPVDERSLAQLERCMEAGDAEFGVLCADHHPGYSQPIGGGIAYEGYVSPSGVGYDIGCGNKAVRTELTQLDLDALGGVEAIMREITTRISFGMGVPAQERTDHPVLDAIRNADFRPQRKLVQLAESQLGTVGSGNHYVNLMEDEEGHVWVGVHFGSRGFGHKTASGFLALAQGLPFDGRASEGEMDSPPVLFDVGSELGESYVAAMQVAGDYAYAGRDIVVAKVLEILGAESTDEVHNHHNFAWREEHFGRTYWVIRKGCTPARPGQKGFVGGSMGDESVILEGVESPENEQALFSRARRRPRDEPDAGCRPNAADERVGLHDARLRVPRRRTSVEWRHMPRARSAAPEGAAARAAQAGRRGLGRSPVAPARAGHRAGGRRSGRGAGGVQAPAGCSRRARRHDPGEAHAPPARCRHGRS
jgi:tRNA-splicing ligase RtcB